MWKPISSLEYLPLFPKGQVLVVACPMLHTAAQLRERWGTRACASIGDTSKYLRHVVRDLLANPQVRAIVFDGPACGRPSYVAFWQDDAIPDWDIEAEHIQLVRRFVDLFDDDVDMRNPMQPFWPARIRYLDKETKET